MKALKGIIYCCLMIQGLLLLWVMLNLFEVVRFPGELWNAFFFFAFGGILLCILRAGIYRKRQEE